jgi:hypothetical protein
MVVLQNTSLSTRVLEGKKEHKREERMQTPILCRTTKNRDIFGEETSVSQGNVRLLPLAK